VFLCLMDICEVRCQIWPQLTMYCANTPLTPFALASPLANTWKKTNKVHINGGLVTMMVHRHEHVNGDNCRQNLAEGMPLFC